MSRENPDPQTKKNPPELRISPERRVGSSPQVWKTAAGIGLRTFPKDKIGRSASTDHEMEHIHYHLIGIFCLFVQEYFTMTIVSRNLGKPHVVSNAESSDWFHACTLVKISQHPRTQYSRRANAVYCRLVIIIYPHCSLRIEYCKLQNCLFWYFKY